MSELAKKLVNDISAYMNPQGEETEHFEQWISEAQPVLMLKSHSEADATTLSLLLEGKDAEEADIISLALNIDLSKGSGDIHIFPKLVQLMDIINRPQQ